MQSAKAIYLQNSAIENGPNFIAINCDANEYDVEVPFVTQEPIDTEHDILMENVTPQDHGSIENGPDDANGSIADDDCTEKDQKESVREKVHENCDNATEKTAELASRVYEKADKTSSASMKLRKMAKKEFLELIPKYFDLNCEICKCRCKSLSNVFIHYRDKHKQTRATVQCCQRKMPIKDIRDHILFHLNPDVFK